MIIDCHTHIGKLGGIAQENKPKNVEDLVLSMKQSEINLSLVIANNLDNLQGTDSQQTIQSVKKYSDKLRAIVKLDYFKIKEKQYQQELISSLKNDLVVGLKFFTGYEKYNPCDDSLNFIYKYCQQTKTPIVFHTGYLLEDFDNNEESFDPTIIDRVAKKFPKLNIILAHFGNPFVKECAKIMKINENVYADLSGYFTELQPISLKEKQLFKKDIEKLKKESGGLNKCLFGTDWWLYDQQKYIEAINYLNLSSKEKTNIFYENSQKIFMK